MWYRLRRSNKTNQLIQAMDFAWFGAHRKTQSKTLAHRRCRTDVPSTLKYGGCISAYPIPCQSAFKF